MDGERRRRRLLYRSSSFWLGATPPFVFHWSYLYYFSRSERTRYIGSSLTLKALFIIHLNYVINKRRTSFHRTNCIFAVRRPKPPRPAPPVHTPPYGLAGGHYRHWRSIALPCFSLFWWKLYHTNGSVSPYRGREGDEAPLNSMFVLR